MATEAIAMPDGHDDPTRDDPPVPRPMIVVQVRRGLMSRLATPLLIAIAAVAVLSHRVKLDDWPGLSAFLGKASAPAPDEARPTPRPPVAVALPSPSVLSIPDPRPALPTGSRPRPIALRPTPMPAGPSPSPFPDRSTKAALAWSEIQRDVERAKAETVALEELKRREFIEDQRRQPIREAEAARQAWQEAEESRSGFREDLRRALSDPRGRAGAAVQAVCEEHGLDVSTPRRVLGTASSPELTTTARRERVEKMRARGFAEPAILEDLAKLESRNRAARGGPRSQQEVLVRAARQLLSVPLPNRANESE